MKIPARFFFRKSLRVHRVALLLLITLMATPLSTQAQDHKPKPRVGPSKEERVAMDEARRQVGVDFIDAAWRGDIEAMLAQISKKTLKSRGESEIRRSLEETFIPNVKTCTAMSLMTSEFQRAKRPTINVRVHCTRAEEQKALVRVIVSDNGRRKRVEAWSFEGLVTSDEDQAVFKVQKLLNHGKKFGKAILDRDVGAIMTSLEPSFLESIRSENLYKKFRTELFAPFADCAAYSAIRLIPAGEGGWTQVSLSCDLVDGRRRWLRLNNTELAGCCYRVTGWEVSDEQEAFEPVPEAEDDTAVNPENEFPTAENPMECSKIKAVKPFHTPMDIAAGVEDCIALGSYKRAAELAIVADVFAKYDTLVVGDTRFFLWLRSELMKVQITEDADSVARFGAEWARLSREVKSRKLARYLCKGIRALGPRDYSPTYILSYFGDSAESGAANRKPLEPERALERALYEIGCGD